MSKHSPEAGAIQFEITGRDSSKGLKVIISPSGMVHLTPKDKKLSGLCLSPEAARDLRQILDHLPYETIELAG